MSAGAQGIAILLGLIAGFGGFLLLNPRVVGSGVGSTSRTRSASSRLSRASLAAATALGIAATVVTFVVSGIIGLALAAGFVGAMATHFVRTRRNAKAARVVDESFPDLIENLISRVRSGVGLLDALAQAAANAPAVVATPAREFWAAVQISGDASACLDDLKESWASPTADLIIETVRVAHDAGGANVVEVLRELADQVRRERNLRREVEAKQSWVRVAARVGVAAPWIVLVLLSFRSEAASAYNSPAGVTLIVCGLALSVVSYRLMISLGRTPAPRRVFST